MYLRRFGASAAALCPAPLIDLTDTLSTMLSVTNDGGYAEKLDGTLQSFSANTLRQTDLGILIEEASTNLMLQSRFVTGWTTSNAAVTAASTTAPDGTSTAATLEGNAVNTNHLIFKSITKAASALPYTITGYFKSKDYTRVFIEIDDGVSNGTFWGFDLSGVQLAYGPTAVGTTFTSLSSTVRSMGNGWVRVRIKCTTNTATTIRIVIDPDNGSGLAGRSTAFAGVVGQGIYAWELQVEQSSVGTSPITTTTTTATRAADVLTISGILAARLASNAGSLVIDVDDTRTSVAGTLIGANGQVVLGKDSSNKLVSTQGATLTGGTAITLTARKSLGLAWDTNGRTIETELTSTTIDKVLDTQAITPAATFYLGSTDGSTGFWNGYIRQLRSWSGRLLDLSLKAMVLETTDPGPTFQGSYIDFSYAAIGVYIDVGQKFIYQYTQPWTSECACVQFPAARTALVFSTAQNSSAFPGYEHWMSNTGVQGVRIINDITAHYVGVQGTTNLNDGLPHVLTATWDGSGLASGVKLYVDGVLETMVTESPLGDSLDGNSITGGSTHYFFIGNQKNHEDFWMRGNMDAFQFSNVVRSQTYINAHKHFSTMLNPSDPNVMLSFALNEGSGTTVTDLSANGFNGTIAALSGTPANSWGST